MRLFTTSPRPAGPRSGFRARLGLEELGGRFAPSTLGGDDPPLYGTPKVLSAAPEIVNFTATPEEDGNGWYVFAGRLVAGENSGGQTIYFGGIQSLQGEWVVTGADGTFYLRIQLLTNGDDHGTASAQANVNGVLTNEALCDVSP